jgi:hypothetical protein
MEQIAHIFTKRINLPEEHPYFCKDCESSFAAHRGLFDEFPEFSPNHVHLTPTGRWRVDKVSPSESAVFLEFFYAVTEWKDLDEDFEYRELKRMWLEDRHLIVKTEWIPTKGEVQECKKCSHLN